MALTRVQIQTAFQNALGRAPSTSEEDSYFAVSQSGALSDATIYTSISNSREANLNADPVVRFYQAAFGRVPDQAGLDNATDYVRSFGATAQTYQTLANQFVTSTEFTNRFGTGTAVDTAYVQALYATILGRQATADEVNAFTSGSNGYTTRGGVLYAISQSQEAIGISDNAVNGFLQNAAQGNAVYTGTLYSSANGEPNIPGANGQTFVLTANADNLLGTTGNDTFNGVVDSGAVGQVGTFTLADVVNGGTGTDNFKIIVNTTAGAQPIPIANVSNIENYFIRNLSGATATFEAAQVAGEQQVWNDRSTGASSVTVNGLGTGATIGVRGDNTGVAYTGTTTFTYASNTDAVTIAIDGGVSGGNITRNQAGEAAVTINSTGAANTVGIIDLNTSNVIESLTINATTSLTAALAQDYDDAVLTVNGAGAVKLTGANVGRLSSEVETIDASANTGGVNIAASANNLKFTGTSSNDRLALGTATGATAALDGGAGTDTIAIDGTDLTTANNVQLATLNARTTSFETLEFDGANAAKLLEGQGSGSLSNTAITKILFNTADAGTDTVTLATAARTYAIGELNTSNLTLNGNSGVTSLNVSFEGITGNGANVGTLTTNFTNLSGEQVGTGTINIASSGANDGTPNTVALINSQSNAGALTLANIKISGSQDLTVGGLSSASAVDASQFTGKLVITGSTGQDTIVGGSLRDDITASTGGDTYTGGGGGDRFIFNNINQASSTTLTTIADFTSGSDRVNVSAISAGTGTFNATAVNVNAAATFAGALDLASTSTTGAAAGVTSYFQYQGNTYVVVDNSNATTFQAGTDGVIKLTGLVTLVAADVTP